MDVAGKQEQARCSRARSALISRRPSLGLVDLDSDAPPAIDVIAGGRTADFTPNGH